MQSLKAKEAKGQETEFDIDSINLQSAHSEKLETSDWSVCMIQSKEQKTFSLQEFLMNNISVLLKSPDFKSQHKLLLKNT